MSRILLLLMWSFFVFNINQFPWNITSGIKKFTQAIFFSVKILFVFRIIVNIFSNSRENTSFMFIYFCCVWFFWIIMTSTSFLKNCLKTDINNKWYFYGFLTMIIFHYLIFFIRHYNFTSFIAFADIFMRITVLFSSKEMKTIQK